MTRWLICLIGAAALAQQPPIPGLRPIPVLPTFTVRTNVTPTAIIITTTTIIPNIEAKRHYYGIKGQEIVYLGEMTKSDYERWAFTGGQTVGTGGGPQVQYWNAVFSTTNQIDPVLVHSRP